MNTPKLLTDYLASEAPGHHVTSERVQIISKAFLSGLDAGQLSGLKKEDGVEGANYTVRLEKYWPNSSNIYGAVYIPASCKLTIIFKNNAQYQYDSFPMDRWDAFCAAPSPGSFVAGNIKGNYSSKKLL